MKKNKPDNILKRWYKLAKPHKGFWVGQMITYTIYTIMLFFVTIFSAQTINYMYNGEWNMAFLFLGIELLAIVIRSLSIHIEYRLYGKQHIHIRNNVAKKVYNKIFSIDESICSAQSSLRPRATIEGAIIADNPAPPNIPAKYVLPSYVTSKNKLKTPGV